MKPNIILNGIYVTAEHYYQVLSESLVLTQSQLQYDAAGAMPTLKITVNTSYTVTVTCETTATVITGSTGVAQDVTHNFSAAGTVTFTGDLDQITKLEWISSNNISGYLSAFTDWTALVDLFIRNTYMAGDMVDVIKHPQFRWLVGNNSKISQYSESLTLPTSFFRIDIDDILINQTDLERLIDDIYSQRAGLPDTGIFDSSGTTSIIDAGHATKLDAMNSEKSWTVSYNT